MAIRTVTICIDENGHNPRQAVWGGMQYEEGATEVVFSVNGEYMAALRNYGEDILFRVDFSSGAAGFDPGSAVGIPVPPYVFARTVPPEMTYAGDNVTVTLVVCKVQDGESMTVLSYPVELYFTPSAAGAEGLRRAYAGISEAERVAVQSASAAYRAQTAAEAAATEAEGEAVRAETAAGLAESAVTAAQGAAGAAESAAGRAETAAGNGEVYKNAALASAGDAAIAKAGALEAQQAAEAAAQQAATYESSACGVATDVSRIQAAVNQTATEAEESAASAAESAQNAAMHAASAEAVLESVEIAIIRDTVSGVAVRMPDTAASLAAEVKVTGVADPTVVTVKRYGKNLLSLPYADTRTTVNGVTFAVGGDGSITLNGTATAYTTFTLVGATAPLSLPNGVTVFLSGGLSTAVQLQLKAVNNTQGTADAGTGKALTASAGTFRCLLNVSSGTTLDHVTVYPQLELGTVDTGFVAGSAPTAYTPGEDGTVAGVMSAPDATWLTDTDGVVISCSYVQNATAVVADLTQRIAALEAAMANT